MTTEEMIEVMKGHPEEVEHYINSIDDAEERIILRTYWASLQGAFDNYTYIDGTTIGCQE